MSKPVAVVTSTIPITVDAFDRELIRQLQAQGYDVCVISSPGPALAKVCDEMSVRVRTVAMTRAISPIADLIALVAWLRAFRAERPSLIVSATPKASLLSLLAGKVTRVPRRLYCLVGLRLEGEHGMRRRLLAVMEKVTSWAATDVVANSPSLAARYSELRLAPQRKLRQTRPGSDHGVDSVHFSPRSPDVELATALGIDRSIPVLGFVGRLTHDKGVETLARAMVLLHADGITCQLLVVGSQNEPDSAAYLDTLTSLGSQVFVVGRVNDVRPYFALMDLHVLPSLREGFPNVVLEASAMALPTVGSDATGAIDSVRNGETGLIVMAEDPQGLAEAIKTLLVDPNLAMQYGLEARKWVVEEFQPESVVRTLLGFDAMTETHDALTPHKDRAWRSDRDRATSMPDLNTPRVSVLLPSMRVDPWLRRALESILNDGYPDIEVILLLDGIREPPSQAWLQDPRVTIVPMGCRVGIARALNIGLEMATSEFVARMDGDDISLPGRLRAQVDFLQANPRVAVVGCQAIRIDEHEVPTGVMPGLTDETAVKRRLLTRNPLTHPSVMFRKSAVLEVGGYSTTARTLEDYDLYIKLASKYEMANLPVSYLNYRVHSDQISRGFNPFSRDKWDLIHRRHQLARAMKVPFVVQSTRDILWYGAQITRYLHVRGRP